MVFECVEAYSVPMVDGNDFVIENEYIHIKTGSLWELDLRDILHEILSISDVRLTDQDGKWIQITWESLQEYFVGVKIK